MTAFTLAEILITLGIIGVIAAITIPVISSNIQKQKTVTALKKSHSNLAQLVKRIEYEYGGVEGMDGCDSTWHKRDREKIVSGQIAPLLPGSSVFDEPIDRPFHTYLCGVDYNYLNGGTWGLVEIPVFKACCWLILLVWVLRSQRIILIKLV